MGAMISDSSGVAAAPVTPDQRFHFDLDGYLHLHAALTREEVDECTRRIAALERTDLAAFNADRPYMLAKHLNRPLSRILDLDHWFLRFLDHPATAPYLNEFLGDGYRHIDNDAYYTSPGYPGGGWHRGVSRHDTGHVRNATFVCPMVKIFFCLTDVGPDEGAFVVVPGSHKSNVEIPLDRINLPGQRIFSDVRAGDVIIFNEGLLHNGRPNPSPKIRKTLIINFGRRDAGVWEGYEPAPTTLAAANQRQREILSNGDHRWEEPVVP